MAINNNYDEPTPLGYNKLEYDACMYNDNVALYYKCSPPNDQRPIDAYNIITSTV